MRFVTSDCSGIMYIVLIQVDLDASYTRLVWLLSLFTSIQ